MSLAGVAFQLAFFGFAHEVPMRNLPEDELLNSRRGILTYLISFRLPYLFVFFSLMFLTAGKYYPRHVITFSLSELSMAIGFIHAWPRTFAYLIGLILFCGIVIVLQRRCLPVDSWVTPVVAILFVLIVVVYFFVVSLVSGLPWKPPSGNFTQNGM